MINGSLLRDAIISAANNLQNQKASVDELNVFPVPDGDTGTNMGMTIAAARRELEKLPDDALIIELASPPYGLDLSHAREMGLRAWLESGVPGRLIPVPRTITAGCGMCWAAPKEAREAVEELVMDRHLDVDGIYAIII